MQKGSLESFKVGNINSIYYIPEYVSATYEEYLLEQIRSYKAKWTQVSGRRLQNHGGIVHDKGFLVQQRLPDCLDFLARQLQDRTGIFGDKAPNHVLVNSYQPGQGIMAHEDGPLYHPGVCILSLGAPAVIRFTRKRRREGDDEGSGRGTGAGAESASVACMPRSLLVFADEAYKDCLHGIDETEADAIHEGVVNGPAAGVSPGDELRRGSERISLTVRRVLRVRGNLLRL